MSTPGVSDWGPKAGEAAKFDLRDFLVSNTTYFRLHALYFIVASLVFGGIIYATEDGQATFVDAWYTSVSCLSQTGLNALDTGKLHSGSKIAMLIAILLGGAVIFSAVPVILRRRYFDSAAASLAATDEERRNLLDELSVEYRALGWVLAIVFSYWFIVQATAFVALALYFNLDPWANSVIVERNTDPTFFAIFLAISSFGNAGFSLFGDNLIPFHNNAFVLLLLSTTVMLGNVAYPVMFRLIVWFLHRYVRPKDKALKFLLDRPRKCFTHMFRAAQTRVLVASILFFTLTEFIFFLGLEFREPYLESTAPPIRALIGWFQAISTRTAGFNAIDLSQVAPAMQLLYAVMMYLSTLPVALTMRKSTDQAAQEEVIMAEVSAAGVVLDPGVNAPLEEGGYDGTDREGEHSSNSTLAGGMPALAGEAVAFGMDGKLAPTPKKRHAADGARPAEGQAHGETGHALERKAVVTLPTHLTGIAEGGTPLPDQEDNDGDDEGDATDKTRPQAAVDSSRTGGSAPATGSHTPSTAPATPFASPRQVRKAVATRRGMGAVPPGGLLNLPGDGFPITSPDIAMIKDDYESSDSDSSSEGAIGGTSRHSHSRQSRQGSGRTRSRIHHVGSKRTAAGSDAGRGAGISPIGFGADTSDAPSPDKPPSARKALAEASMGDSSLEMPHAVELASNVGLARGSSFINLGGLVIEDEASKSIARAGFDFLTSELPLLGLALFVISLAESDRIRTDPAKFLGLWPIAFELASAYGTVGLTLGYPGSPLSLSGLLTPFSKVVIMAVMLAGRHRGLPAAIDPAVHLPSLLNKKPKRTIGGLTALGGSFMDIAQASVRSFLPAGTVSAGLRFLGITEDDPTAPQKGGEGLGQTEPTVTSLGRGVSFLHVPGQPGQYIIPTQITAGALTGAQLAAVGQAIARGASFKVGTIGRNSHASVGRGTGATFGRARPPIHPGTFGRAAQPVPVHAHEAAHGSHGRGSVGQAGSTGRSARTGSARPALAAIFEQHAANVEGSSRSGSTEPADSPVATMEGHKPAGAGVPPPVPALTLPVPGANRAVAATHVEIEMVPAPPKGQG